jgi:hypothetical protein
MANLMMAFTSEVTMGLVFKAKTAGWLSGLAHLVVSGLNKKYNPQDTISRVELRQRLSAIRTKKNEDPATLFKQISSIENKFNTSTRHIEEEDLIAVVLDAAPQEKKLTSILRCRFVHHMLLRTVDPRAWHARVCGAIQFFFIPD